MFFENPLAALQNLLELLEPGGRLPLEAASRHTRLPPAPEPNRAESFRFCKIGVCKWPARTSRLRVNRPAKRSIGSWVSPSRRRI
jgi:hypothetical protein